MKLLAIALVLTAISRPEMIDCDLIRARVAEHGKVKSYMWALANGYSPKEIARIRKVCGL